MNVAALKDLLESLDETALKMRETSEEMMRMSDHPNIQKHGLEMRGAAEMADDWIDGITREVNYEENL